jgi:hypothetical protein
VWINSETGEIYGGDRRSGSADFAAPSEPPPGVTHVVLDESGAFVAWADLPSPPPDYPALRQAIAQLPAWRSLVATDGRAVELSRCLGEQDLDTATIWWDDLVAAGLISDELKADIAQAAIAANMPQQLLDALA